jgi:hypothetical protein
MLGTTMLDAGLVGGGGVRIGGSIVTRVGSLSTIPAITGTSAARSHFLELGAATSTSYGSLPSRIDSATSRVEIGPTSPWSGHWTNQPLPSVRTTDRVLAGASVFIAASANAG